MRRCRQRPRHAAIFNRPRRSAEQPGWWRRAPSVVSTVLWRTGTDDAIDSQHRQQHRRARENAVMNDATRSNVIDRAMTSRIVAMS
jgi:hypothetical protein